MCITDKRTYLLRQPIPVCLTRKDLKGELQRAVSSTYMNQNQGTCTLVPPALHPPPTQLTVDLHRSIKIGTAGQTPAQILENLKLALPAVVQNTFQGWENVQSFNIKTNSSVSLPIWSCSLEDDDRWDGMILDDNEVEGGSDDGEEDEEDAPAKPAKKANKRGATDEEEALEKGRKKAKTSAATVEVDTPAPQKSKNSSAAAVALASKDASAASPSSSKKAKKAAETKTAEPSSPAVTKKAKAAPASEDVASSSPSASKSAKKIARAQAVDFFEGEVETTPSSVSKKASKKWKGMPFPGVTSARVD